MESSYYAWHKMRNLEDEITGLEQYYDQKKASLMFHLESVDESHPILIEISNSIEEAKKERERLKLKVSELEAVEDFSHIELLKEFETALFDIDEDEKWNNAILKQVAEEDAKFGSPDNTYKIGRYCLLDELLNAKIVSCKEYVDWMIENGDKYDRQWSRDSGTKEISMIFYGIEKSDGEILLFKVTDTYKDYDGNVIRSWEEDFSTYQEALDAYEILVQENS